jgi:hypothetical protein
LEAIAFYKTHTLVQGILIMTHVTHTQQALSRYTLKRLKRIAVELGVTPTGDKRAADTWVNAIIAHQSSQLQKVDEQAVAQGELDGYMTDQAVAVEELTTVEISFYDHEIYAGSKLIASITHDDDLTQPWVVMVNGKEKFRANTWARCHRYITWHHQDRTLNEELPATLDQTEAALPAVLNQTEIIQTAPEAELPTTGNEVMVQIFTECEKFGLEILNDGIYRENIKLGEVGCTNGNWWVVRVGEQERVPCDSALDAVWWLSMVDVLPTAETEPGLHKELSYRRLEQLTSNELQILFENAELVAV